MEGAARRDARLRRRALRHRPQGRCNRADGSTIPNGGTVPAYYTISIGGEQSFKAGLGREWKVRLDVLNLTDNSYELRDGSGVGVNAAQYGMRRGFFGSVSYSF